MRTFILAVLLWTLGLSPVQAASAAPAEADDIVVCDKAAVADVIIVAIKVKSRSGFLYACGNGLNGGGMSLKDDVPFFVHDYTDTPEKRLWAYGVPEAAETPTGIWWSIHRVNEPLGQHLKMTRWTP